MPLQGNRNVWPSPGSQPKRVLHCIPTLAGGGAERQLVYLCNGLARAGWQVTVAVVSHGPNLHRLDRERIEVVRLPHVNSYDPQLLWHLIALARRFRPILIHTWLTMMDVLGGMVSWATGIPWVGSERSSELDYSSTNWKDRLRLFVFNRFADGIIANSNAGRIYLQRHLSPKVPCHVIPNAVPLEEIDKTAPASLVSLGLPDESEIVLWAGRFVPLKNLRTLFPALALVLRSAPRPLLSFAVTAQRGFSGKNG